MGFIANLLRRKSLPEEKVDSSLKMLDMLKAKRGDDIGKYLDMMYDPRKIPAPSAPPTIEDLDERELDPSSIYSPPIETMTYQRDYDGPDEFADLADSEDPIESSINRFFDVFAGQANLHNEKVNSLELAISIQRPQHSSEMFPEGSGKQVLNACLHTAHWGLFFFGHDNNVDLYLLPYSENTPVSFKEVHTDECQPHIVFTTSDGSSGRQWYANSQLLVREGIPDLAAELLSDLVHAATDFTDANQS
ncbi:hypothetical protein KBI23_20060 [bacterium]|nr:hypothetical protein [bacterium]